MGIKFHCHACGKKLNVKSFLAGRRGICPHCQAKIEIPPQSDTARPADESSPATPAADADTAARQSDAPPAKEFDLIATVGTAPTAAASPSPAKPSVGPADPAGHEATKPIPRWQSASAEIDAINAAPDAKWFVRPASGGQYGPAPAEVMKDWIHQGRVAAESLVWREGWAEWKPAAQVLPRLARELAAPAPPEDPIIAASPQSIGPVQLPDTDPVVAEVVAPLRAAQPSRRAAVPRRRSNASNVVIVVFLLLAVLVLLPVLVYVLMKQSSGGSEESATAWLRGKRTYVQAAPPCQLFSVSL